MSKERSFPAKRPVKHYVQRQRREPLLAADHMTYLHQVIVDYICQVIGGHAVRFEKHLVIKGAGIHHNMTSYHIVKMNILIHWHPVTYYIRSAIFQKLVPFGFGQRQRILKIASC